MARARREVGRMHGRGMGSSEDLAKIREASRLLASVDPTSPLAAWSHANSAHINQMLDDLGLSGEDVPPRPAG